jgi:hypothetical protein
MNKLSRLIPILLAGCMSPVNRPPLPTIGSEIAEAHRQYAEIRTISTELLEQGGDQCLAPRMELAKEDAIRLEVTFQVNVTHDYKNPASTMLHGTAVMWELAPFAAKAYVLMGDTYLKMGCWPHAVVMYRSVLSQYQNDYFAGDRAAAQRGLDNIHATYNPYA